MTDMKYPMFIDCEASGLHPDSYPIQIAWNYDSGLVESHLIRPAISWEHWDFTAQNMHGFSRDFLFEHGESVESVAKRMNEALEGKKLYSDAASFDSGWIDVLFSETDLEKSFIIKEYQSLIYDMGFQYHWFCSLSKSGRVSKANDTRLMWMYNII